MIIKYERSLIDDVKYSINLIPETQEEIDLLNKYWKKGSPVNVFVDNENDSLTIKTYICNIKIRK